MPLHVTALRSIRWLLLSVLLFALGSVGRIQAQPKQGTQIPQPRIQVVSPAGGKAGTTFDVLVTGQGLEMPQGLLFSHAGIKAERIETTVVKNDPQKKAAAPVVQQAVRFKVSVDPATPIGTHDLRFVNDLGVSNPRAFVVGDQDEVLEQEPNNDVDQAQRVELNHVVHGVLSSPVDVDYYVFQGKKGQRVVVSCLASSIDSRAEPALQLYSPKGLLLASNRSYQGSDALLDRTLTEDGDYLVRLYSFTYTQGGPEHFYRLSISTTPWIDAVFPPLVVPGRDNTLTVYGRNLPGGKLDPTAVVNGSVLETLTVHVKAPADPLALQRLEFPGFLPPRSSELDGFPFQLSNAQGKSNAVLLVYARAPVVLDQGDNDTSDKAQKLDLPCDLAGRIEKARDRDWYRFTVKKGEKYSIEVMGDRLGSRLDMYYTLRPAQGKGQPQEFDDNPDVLHPLQFFSRSEDPQRQSFVAAVDSDYLLQVSSREADQEGSPRHIYRLRITPEQPDFRLIAMPSNPRDLTTEVLGAGGSAFLTMLVWRQDGFNNAITLSADGLPEGVTCVPQVIGPGQRQGALVLTADENAKPWTGFVTIRGTATIDGKPVVREARSASITWPTPAQQNVPAVSRLDHGFALAVRGKGFLRVLPATDTVKASPGDKVPVAFKVERHGDFKGPITLTLVNYPQTALVLNNNQPLTIAADKSEINGILDLKTTLAPGTYTVVLRTSATVPFSRDGKTKTPSLALGASTPLTLTIVPKAKPGKP